ncbi:MAG: arginine--tRNA ligase [Myxococcota bacterium]
MQEKIRELLAPAVAEIAGDAAVVVLPEIAVELTKREEHGDFTSNVAMALAGKVGRRPREIAEAIRARVGDGGGLFEAVEVAGPGFLNFRVASSAWRAALGEVLARGADWGRGAPRPHPRVLLEHPSPNPTGPLHVGHGRIAAVGDSLARVMRFAGWDVTTECYVNDHGSKIRAFAASIVARAAGKEPPEGGYRGEYVAGIAESAGRAGVPMDDLSRVGEFAIAAMIDDIRGVLGRFRVTLDGWAHEKELYARGDVARAVDTLRAGGWIEEREGAVFFRSTELGDDDKDRVVVRRTGEPTYFAADIAYHRDKLDRGYDLLIDVLGADHHGHLARMRGAMRALGQNPSAFEAVLVQIVTLLRAGQAVAMDKSSGQFVTLAEVIDEVGADAARFFFLMRRHDGALDFDLDLAKKQSLENPVYYVQYGHARCASILRRAAELGFEVPPWSDATLARLELAEELAVVRRLADFPKVVAGAAEAREPHRVVTYVHELAQAFQSYYTRLQKVHGDPILPQRRDREGESDWRARWDERKTGARLLWVTAVKTVLETGLGLVGVEAPDRMTRPVSPAQEEEEDA